MIILRHNTLLAKDLFVIERIMLKISESPYQHSLDYSLLNKTRGEVYGFIAGIFKRMEICQTLGITTSDFLDFLIDIERGYNDNPYHSFYHAVDVTMVLYHMIEQYDISEYLSRVDLAMVMIAALCHDIGHPGKNNHFEVCCKTEIANQYNNLSVLESHSSGLTLELIDKHNLLRNIESRSSAFGVPISKQDFKKSVVKMILATDMVCHFTLQDNISALRETVSNSKEYSQVLKEFQTAICIEKSEQELKPLYPKEKGPSPFTYFEQHYFNHSESPNLTLNNNTTTLNYLLDQEERLMLCNILIHAADISNPSRPWPVSHELSRLVCIEFFRQGEEERKLGLPISPNMNRHEANPSSINVGFIDFIVQPYFEALSALFPKCQELVTQCTKNRGEWLKLSSERIDIFGNKLLPIEVTLGGSITTHVTIAAGTVQIPGYIEQDIRQKLNRSVSFNILPHKPDWLLSSAAAAAAASAVEEQEEEADDMGHHFRKSRRKSEEFSLLHQVSHRNRWSISKGRRKSDVDSNIHINQPKMVSFFDYE